jgi:aryl-alcohol dehydrogenase-like predicted oxidoreductase
VIPGASTARQVTENALSMATTTSPDLWRELKEQELIAAEAPTPA